MRGSRLVAGLVAVLVLVGSGGCRHRESNVVFDQRDGEVPPVKRVVPPPEIPDKLPHGARALYVQNGFVVLGNVQAQSITGGYFEALGRNFITADAVLYVFHCLFRGGLSEYEKDKLLPLATELVDASLAEARKLNKRYASDAVLAEPARRNVVFFAVAQTLLTGTQPPDEPTDVSALVKDILAASKPGFYPDEDFTIYKPRGVYASDPELEKYFRGMKWLGRQILPVIPGWGDKEPDATIKLRQAYLLGRLLHSSRAGKLWRKLDSELSFLLTYPDSITPSEFMAGLKGAPAPSDASWAKWVRAKFCQAKYPSSRIQSTLQGSPGQAPSKYVQFLGERYIPDGQIHQEATFPHVGNRTVPRGLDIGYALFGSERAKVHLSGECAAYPDLSAQLDRLQKQFGTWGDEKEPTTVYSAWVSAVREVVNPPTSSCLPKFLSTEAWKDKSLNTALASWTQMRHDFILYARQPVTPGCAGMEWFVEPVPGAYRKLSLIAGKLASRDFPGMEDFSHLCLALQYAAEAELRGGGGQTDEEMHRQWATIPGKSSWDFYIGAFGQWLLSNFSKYVAAEQPCVVVDVATDSNPPNPVLHEATGPLQLVVIPDSRDGHLYGWVLSYYEFTEDHFSRLTDEEWQERVRKGNHRKLRPEWTSSYMYAP